MMYSSLPAHLALTHLCVLERNVNHKPDKISIRIAWVLHFKVSGWNLGNCYVKVHVQINLSSYALPLQGHTANALCFLCAAANLRSIHE